MVKCFEHRWGRIFWFDAFDALDHLPPNNARYANRQQKFLILHLFYGCISVFFFVWLQLTRQNSDSNWNLDGTCLPHLFGLKPCDFYIFFKHVTTFDMEFEWFFPKPPPKKITAHGKVHTHTHTTTEFNGMLWIVCGIEVHFDSQPTRLEPEEKVYRDVLRRYTDTDAIDQSDLRHFLEGVGFKPRSKPERDLLTPSTHKKGLLMFVGWWGENAACSVWFWGMGVVMIGMRDEVCRASWLFCW